jgi:hypothetical protein
MLIFNNSHDLILAISKETLRAPLKMHSLNYKLTLFECGCLENHNLDDPTNSIFANTTKGILPVRFIIKCCNNFYTLVTISGFFKSKSKSEWSTSKKTLNEGLKVLGLPDLDTIKF